MHHRSRTILLVFAVVTPFLLPAATAGTAWTLTLEDVTRDPDAPDTFTLTLRSGTDAPASHARVRVHANFTDADGARDTWREDQGVMDVSPGSRLVLPFTASRGPGTYRVDVVAEAPTGTGAARDVTLTYDGDGVEGRFVVDVEDTPTHLAYTSDGVNDPGKTKSPGRDLITRVDVADENGLNGLTLAFAYARVDDTGRVPVSVTRFTDLDGGDRNVTSTRVEHRFDEAPMVAGVYVENVSVVDANGTRLAGAERTFNLTDTRPFLADATPFLDAPLVPDRPRVLNATVRIADTNYGTGPLDDGSVTALGIVEGRLYWWSRTVTDPGWSLVLGNPASGEDPTRLDLRDVGHRDGAYPYETVEDAGALAVPVRVKVPAGVAPGDYRVTLVHATGPDAEPTRLGTVPFTVAALPRVDAVAVDADPAPGETLPVHVTIADARAAVLRVRLLDPAGDVVATSEVRDAEGAVTLALELPTTLSAGEHVLEVRALAAPDSPDADAGPGVARLTLPVATGPPHLALVPDGETLRAGPGGPAGFTVEAWNFTPSDVTFELAAPDGKVTNATERVTRRDGDRYRLDVRDLSAGTWTLLANATGPDGAAVTGRVPVHVDAWLGVRLPAEPTRLVPDDAGRLTGALDLAANGNVPVQRVLVIVGPFPDGRPVTGTAHVEGPAGASRAEGTLENGRVLLDGRLLDAGESGPRLAVTVDVPPGLDAGRHEVPVRVLLVPGGGAR